MLKFINSLPNVKSCQLWKKMKPIKPFTLHKPDAQGLCETHPQSCAFSWVNFIFWDEYRNSIYILISGSRNSIKIEIT